MIPYVPEIVPNILQALVFVTAFVVALAPAMRKFPIPFYILFVVACMGSFVDVVRYIPWLYTLDTLLASCYTGVAFYLLVMFTGALPRQWWLTRRLYSVRTEMSIIGGFAIFTHVIQAVVMVPLAFTALWSKAWAAAAPIMFVACVIVGVPLLICFMVPWITSFRVVRNSMQTKTWRKIQKLAYPFMALLVAQGILLGVGHAAYYGPGTEEFTMYMVNAATYMVIGVLYLVLKIRKIKQRKR